jgi:DNA-binding cell septation regulator SpoVG
MIWPTKGNTKVRANGVFTINGILKIKFTIFQGPKGLFVSLPREQYTKDGEQKWSHLVSVEDETFKSYLETTLLSAYENKVSGVNQGPSAEPASQVLKTGSATKKEGKQIPF